MKTEYYGREDLEEVTISVENLKNNILNKMRSLAIADEVSEAVIENLIFAQMRGNDSHGLTQLKIVLANIVNHKLNKDPSYKVISNVGSTAILDGQHGVGYYIAKKAMKLTIQKALEHGIAMVCVRNSSHFGVAGYYAHLASQKKMIGIALTNTRPLVATNAGKRPVLGTNPIGAAFPYREEERPFLLDMSTSIKSFNDIRIYAQQNKETPRVWGINERGGQTKVPDEILHGGALLPLGGYGTENGGHKGFGLSLMVEILCGILSDGLTSIEIGERGGNACHAFIVIDPEKFVGADVLQNRCKDLFDRICEGDNQTLIPGEHGWKKSREAQQAIKISRQLFEELSGMQVWAYT